MAMKIPESAGSDYHINQKIVCQPWDRYITWMWAGETWVLVPHPGVPACPIDSQESVESPSFRTPLLTVPPPEPQIPTYYQQKGYFPLDVWESLESTTSLYRHKRWQVSPSLDRGFDASQKYSVSLGSFSVVPLTSGKPYGVPLNSACHLGMWVVFLNFITIDIGLAKKFF